MLKRMLVFAVAVVAAWTTVARAQVTTGTITGTVTDPSGAVLPGAKIEITSAATGATRMATSDASGHYSVPQLAVGHYKVSGSLEGFQTEVRNDVEVAVGGTSTIDMKLQVGAVTQTVEVTGEAPLIQTTESQVSNVVQDQQLRDLPLNGRDMSQLILLNPGVNVSNTQGGQAYNGYGARISISGMRGEDNTYLMDGQLIGDFRRHIPAGPSGAMLGVESVQEFQVITNSLSAQYGRALGGVFNAVSKSGSNAWHGDAYDFLRNDKLDAGRWEDNANSTPKPPFRRNQFGGTVGGPIIKDKTFFWAGYESTRQALSFSQTPLTMNDQLRQGILQTNFAPNGTVVAINPIMQPYINQYPRPTPGAKAFQDGTQQYVFIFNQPTIEHFGQARVDFPTLRQNDSFFVRFTGSASSQPTPYSNNGSFPGYTQSSSLGSFLLTLSETHIFSPAVLNTLRVHASRVVPDDEGLVPPRSSLPNPICGSPSEAATGGCILVAPGQSDIPEVTPTGLAGIGGGGFATKPTIMTANRFTYQDDVNWTKGSHHLQFGGFVERFQLNSTKPNRAWGVWTFTNVSNFLTDNSTQFRGAVPGFGVSNYKRGLRNWMFATYIQDDWRVNSRLTVNLGLRWEPYTVPTEVNGLIANLHNIYTDTPTTASNVGGPYWQNKSLHDFGPRIGFAFDPFGTGKTSIRGGYAKLYSPNDPNLYYNQMDRMPPFGFDFTLPIPAGFNRFPDAVAELNALNTSSPAYTVPYFNSKDSTAQQWNFNIQQQIGGSSLLSVGYAGSHGNHLVSVGDLNIPRAVFDGVSLAIPDNADLVNPSWPSILSFGNNTSSEYNALLVAFKKRFSTGFQGQVSYTYGKSMSDSDSGQTGGGVTTGGGRLKYPDDSKANWGLSGYNFKHNFTFNYSYDLPFGKGKSGLMGKLMSGWQTTGVFTMRSGQPINLSAGVSTVVPAAPCVNVNGGACKSLNQLAVTPRSPNLTPGYTTNPFKGKSPGCTIYEGPTTSLDGTVFLSGGPAAPADPKNITIAAGTPLGGSDLYFDPCAYTFPGSRELGNLGRNTVIGPNYAAWNPALLKKTPITERTSLEFRFEMFNVLNRVNLSTPAASLYGASGTFTATAGTITSTINNPRQLQFALKLIF